MASYDFGKKEIEKWIRDNFPIGSTCLDVGPCDGKWADMLRDHLTMDAVEIFRPNIEEHGLKNKYRNVICGDIADQELEWYDLIIFGDVIEHMTVEKAQKVLRYAKKHCRDMIVSVPWLLEQDAIYGNPWEVHVQADLTEEIFRKRYEGFEPLWMSDNYAYWHLKKDMRIVYEATRNYYPYLRWTIQSLLEHNDPEIIYILAEDDSIPDLPEVCKVINVTDQKWIRKSSPNYKSWYSWMVLMRVCLPEILDCDKVLQLDIDMVICDSLRPVWETDVEGKWIAAVRERAGTYRPFGMKYYNMGVSLFNLEQMRKDGAMQKLVRELNSVWYPCPEQDAINKYAVPDKITDIPARYNECFCCGYTENPAVIHFAGERSWMDNPEMFRGEYLEKYKTAADRQGKEKEMPKVKETATKKTAEKKTEKKKEFEPFKGRVVNVNLNVRSKPGMDGSIVKVLPGGTPVEVIGQKKDWYEIKDGWVMSMFIEHAE